MRAILAATLVAACVLIAGCEPGAAQTPKTALGPKLTHDQPVRDDHFWTLMLSVTNSTEPRGLSRVGIDCVFFNVDKPVDKSGKLVSGIEFGKTVHDKVTGPPAERAVTRAECRVDYAYPVK